MMLRRPVALAQADHQHLDDAALVAAAKVGVRLDARNGDDGVGLQGVLVPENRLAPAIRADLTAVISVLTGTPRACSLTPLDPTIATICAKNSGAIPYWRVEGSLLELTTVRPVAFFTWNAQKFTERWQRRGTVLIMALLRPFLYVLNRTFATRVVYSILRGISRDRLDLLNK